MNENEPTVSRAMRTVIGVHILLVLALVGSAILASAVTHAATVRSVPLSAAAQPPTDILYVGEGERVNLPTRDLYGSDVQAYAWDGSAIGAQRWDAHRLAYVWRAHRGRVFFDGASVVNRSHAPILFGVWTAAH